MGNQREIIQTEPVRRRGVVLRVRPEAAAAARELVEPAGGKFYSYVVLAGEPDSLHNMDGPVGQDDEALPPADVLRVAIQSGGKMWCGYDVRASRQQCPECGGRLPDNPPLERTAAAV